MSKKVFFLISFVLVLALCGSASAQTPFDLQLWAEYLFDTPDPCADTGGSGYDIIGLSEGATVGVVAGSEGTAYHGDIGDYNAATDEYQYVPEAELPLEVWPGTGTGNFTIELMIYFDEEHEEGEAGHVEEDGWLWWSQCPVFEDGFYFQFEYGVYDVNGLFQLGDNLWFEPSLDDDWWGYVSTVNYEAGQWYHWVTSFDNTNKVIRHWVDGVLVAEDFDHVGDDFSQVPLLENVILGSFGGSDPLRGRIDTVRFYKGYTAELPLLPAGGVWPSNPNPAPGEDHVRRDTKICFQAPRNAVCLDPNADPNLKGPFNYDVYFGTDPNVLTMKLIADNCQPDECNDVVCIDPCVGDLAAGTTYYWRVDVNDLDPADPCFYESLMAFSFRTWGFADDESPADGEGGVKPSVILSWVEDDYASSRDIYFDTNEAAVTDANTANTATYPGVYRGSTAPVDPCDPNRNTYDPPELLDLLTEAFWRIDEVNNSVAVKGDVWSFETASYFVVEDSETYVDKDALQAVWTVGHLTNNGAELFLETGDVDRIYGGDKSMRFAYRNLSIQGQLRGSEAVADIADLQSGSDWTRGGAEALVLYFQGDPINGTDHDSGYANHITQDQMYVALEDGDTKVGVVKYDEEHGYDMNDIKKTSWQEWNIDLQDPCLAVADVNLANVAKVYIGFGGQKTGQTAAGAGVKSGGFDTVWFDDIQLHPPRCIPSGAYPYGDLDEDCVISVPDLDIMSEVWLDKDFEAPVIPPNDANLLVWYMFDNPADGYAGLSDSSTTPYHGIAVNDVSVHDGMLTLLNENTWQTYGYSKSGYWDYPAEMNAVEIPFPSSADVWNNSYTIFIEARTHQDNTGLAWDDVWPIMYMSVSDPVSGATCESEITWYHAYEVLRVYMGLDDTWAASADHACQGSSAEYGNVADANWHKIVWIYDADIEWHYCYVDVYGNGGFDPWGENGEPYAFTSSLDPCKPWKTLIGASYAANQTSGVIAEEGTSFMTGDVNEIRIYDYAASLGEALALLGQEGIMYVPLDSPANYVPKDPCDSADPNLGSGALDPNNLDIINFRDYLVIANNWLKEILWPLE